MKGLHLAIDINFSAVRFVKLNGSEVLEDRLFFFLDRQDYRYKPQLDEFWSGLGWQESDFEDVTLSWSENQSTIVPVNIFNESNKEAIFQLCFGAPEVTNVIDYNRLPLQNLVNVYAIPLWVKSFFVIRFPRIIMQHEGTHVLRGVFSGATYKLKSKLVVHQNHFLLVIVQDNKLKFSSTFNFSSVEDVVYYFSYTVQQLELGSTAKELELIAGSGCQLDLNQLETALKTILKDNLEVIIGASTLEKYQQLCV